MSTRNLSEDKEEKIHVFNLHLPWSLYQSLRYAAYVHEVPMSEIIRDGVRTRLKEIGAETDESSA